MFIVIHSLFYSLKIIIDILAASVSTVLLGCYLTKTPIWNPNHSRKELVEKIINVLETTIFGLSESAMITTILMSYDYIVWVPHSWIVTSLNMGTYIALIELFFYMYHRTMHTAYFFKRVHYKHHEGRDVYPLDAFYLSYFDLSCTIAVLTLPALLLRVNLMEYSLIQYLYVTGGFIVHSDMIVNDHQLHHRKLKGNYCFLIPIFDILWKTTLEE